jgi:glyoxylase-like metal-dependent hydrolase (beta-lactamase superfamily II)
VRVNGSRRAFCRLTLAGVAGGVLPWPSYGQGTRGASKDAAAVPAAVQVGESVFVIAGGGGGNVVVALGPDAALVVNGGHASRAPATLARVQEVAGGRPIRTLFNTDWHAEHTGLNEAVGRAGGAIVAHEFTRQYLGTEMTVEWQGTTYAPLPKAALPTTTCRTAGSMTLGGETVEYGPLGQAHTDGDLYVFFRRANVLVAGDVLSVGTYPIADYNSGGWLGGLATANKTLLDLTGADTRYVPGAGPTQPRAALQAQYEMLSAMRDRMHKAFRQGMGASDMLAAGLSKDFDPAWGAPERFIATSYRGMWLHIRELGGVV